MCSICCGNCGNTGRDHNSSRDWRRLGADTVLGSTEAVFAGSETRRTSRWMIDLHQGYWRSQEYLDPSLVQMEGTVVGSHRSFVEPDRQKNVGLVTCCDCKEGVTAQESSSCAAIAVAGHSYQSWSMEQGE